MIHLLVLAIILLLLLLLSNVARLLRPVAMHFLGRVNARQGVDQQRQRLQVKVLRLDAAQACVDVMLVNMSI